MSTLSVLDNRERCRIALTQIEYLAGVGNYTWVHIAGEKPVLVARTLKVLSERVTGFIRINKGLLVNPAHVTGYQIRSRMMCTVQMSGDRTLVISRRRAQLVLTQLCKPSSSPIA